jgi:hypothetical protein
MFMWCISFFTERRSAGFSAAYSHLEGPDFECSRVQASSPEISHGYTHLPQPNISIVTWREHNDFLPRTFQFIIQNRPIIRRWVYTTYTVERGLLNKSINTNVFKKKIGSAAAAKGYPFNNAVIQSYDYTRPQSG